MNQERILEDTLRVFFKTSYHRSVFLDVIFHRVKISLRLLDYLCTNYSKHNNSSFEVKKGNSSKTFYIYQSYKSQLKTFSKKYFDPFCRRERILIPMLDPMHNKEIQVETTIGQLNFFRWCIYNHVYEYAIEHGESIEKEMNLSIQKRYQKREPKEKKKTTGSFKVSFS